MGWTNEDIEQLRTKLQDKKFFRLNYLKLKLIDACNLRCPKCDYWQIQRKPELGTDEIKEVIDQGLELGLRSIHLSGGEPTLRKDLLDIVQYGNERGVTLRTITNGTYLKPEKQVELAQAGITGWTFSLDGYTPEQHDLAMGREGAFDKIIESISALTEARERYGTPQDVTIATVVSRNNIFDLMGLIKLAYGLGVDSVKLSPYDYRQTTLNTLEDSSLSALNPSQDEIRRYNEETVPAIREFSQRRGFPVYPSFGLEIFGKSYEEIALGSKGLVALGNYDKNPCFMPWQHLTIYANGDIHICCKKPTVAIGNVKKDKLTEVVDNEFMTKTREMFSQNKPLHGCGSCAMKLYENKLIGDKLE